MLSRALVITVALTLVGTACGGDGGGDATTSGDAAAVPVAGDWYRPTADTTWQWQLLGEINTGYDVDAYDIDLFDAPESTIADLQAAGRKVICYFSGGSSEDWRRDAGEFDDADLGNALDGWEGESWLDIRSGNVRDIMEGRLDMAVEKGCDGVEPDNVDGYTSDTGFDLTAADQLEFNRWLSGAAHSRGLAVGLKNSGDQAAQLVDYFDFSLNEQCHEFDECDQLQVFLDAGKPIWNAEYAAADTVEAAAALAEEICETARDEENIRTLILPLDLDDSFRIDCDSF